MTDNEIGKFKFKIRTKCTKNRDGLTFWIRANGHNEAIAKLLNRLESQKKYIEPRYGSCSKIVSVEKEKITK